VVYLLLVFLLFFGLCGVGFCFCCFGSFSWVWFGVLLGVVGVCFFLVGVKGVGPKRAVLKKGIGVYCLLFQPKKVSLPCRKLQTGKPTLKGPKINAGKDVGIWASGLGVKGWNA